MSEYNIQMNKYNALNANYDQLYPVTKIEDVNGLGTALQNKSDSSSVYTKEESISASTRTALSLPETATPDAAFAEIARQLPESGGLKLIKLWENASPTSEFQAHSVTFDTSSSKAFIVSYKPHADAAYNFVLNAILVGKNNAVEMQSVIGSGGVHIGGMAIGVRKVTVTETGATFDSAYFVSTTDSFTAHTKFCIPTVIYGIE